MIENTATDLLAIPDETRRTARRVNGDPGQTGTIAARWDGITWAATWERVGDEFRIRTAWVAQTRSSYWPGAWLNAILNRTARNILNAEIAH